MEDEILENMPEKEKTIFSKSEKIMACLVPVFAFLFVHLALWNESGFFTTLLYIILITAGVIFLCRNGCKFTRLNILTAVLLYVFSLVFSITANNFVKSLDLIFMLAAGAYFVYSTACSKKRISRFLPYELIGAVLKKPFDYFFKEYSALKSVFRKNGLGSTACLVIAGLLLAVPLTAVVACLLMSADNGVKKILMDAFDLLANQKAARMIFLELLVSIPAAFWLFGLFYSGVHKNQNDSGLSDEESYISRLEKKRRVDNIIIYTAVTPICLLYTIFFVSQLTYFLSAFSGHLPENYSYAAYARKGFFELFAIELINAGVILFMNLYAKKGGVNKPKALKFYTLLISVFTLIITAAAFSKMIMYIDVYGLTRLRVYTSWFMMLTFILFILAIIAQFKKNFHFMGTAAAVFTVMFAALCFSRPDALIARYNLETHQDKYGCEMSESDVEELVDMSDDAAAVIFSDSYSERMRTIFGDDSWNEFRQTHKNHLESDFYSRTNLSALIITLVLP